MTYEERVRAIAASAPPLTSAQLATIATNLKASGPSVHSAKNRNTGTAYRSDRYSSNV